MSDLNKQKRAAIEAVARRFSAKWEKGTHPLGAYLTVAGKRVAVDITALKRRATGHGNEAKPHLRFDKEVIRLMAHLQAALRETVPDGITVALTVTAPIRLGSKTAVALEHKIQTLLTRKSPGRDEKDTIHGNRVRIRLLKRGSKQAPKMVGFVHNSDSDPILLLDMTRELLELITAEADRRARKHSGNRWLVLVSVRGSSCLEAYRYIFSQLRMTAGFKKTLIVFGDGRVELLAG